MTTKYPTAGKLGWQRRQVWEGKAEKTRGGLYKRDLKKSKSGRIVSKKKSAQSKRKQMALKRSGQWARPCKKNQCVYQRSADGKFLSYERSARAPGARAARPQPARQPAQPQRRLNPPRQARPPRN